MQESLLAIGLAAVSAFVLGGLWYSSMLFGKRWQLLAGLSDEAIAKRPHALIFTGAFLLSLVAAFVFAMFLGPRPGLGFATGAGFSAGLCWVAASYGINCLFEGRPVGLWLINGGYFTLQFTLYGLVIGWLG